MAKKSLKKNTANTVARPFETDYAGAWKGHCLTRENATKSAQDKLVSHGYSRATITDVRTGETIVRMHLSRDRKTLTIEAVKPFRKIGE